MKSLEELFWAKVEKTDHCWNWTGAKSKNGYGNFITAYNRGLSSLPHRVSLEIAGRSVPSDMVVDHECYNRLCVNPDHLAIVTQRENVVRERSHSGPERSNKNQNSMKEFCKNGHSNWKIGPTRRDCVDCKRESWRKQNDKRKVG